MRSEVLAGSQIRPPWISIFLPSTLSAANPHHLSCGAFLEELFRRAA
jgi:hypothetical protein